MNINEKIKELSIKQKIAQMFIMGFSGTDINKENINLKKLLNKGLGGIILFAQNIQSNSQLKNLINELQNLSSIPLFMSIDQEGGLVERTIFKDAKYDFLTPMALANSKSIADIQDHTQIMSKELHYLGINMNFAPVLDVNTNKLNPIIGIRSFADNPDDVAKYSEPVYKTLSKNKIIPVGKHFPGHGEAWTDSHLDMPEIDLNIVDLEQKHIKPFKNAIDNDIDSLMIAHVHYKAFNKEKIPASLSKELITDYLKTQLNFKGLIISDDLVMGGITNNYSRVESCIMAINAGIDILIFRDSSDENVKLIDELNQAIINGEISEERIDESIAKILEFKLKYGLFDIKKLSEIKSCEAINYIENQQKIDNIALKSIKLVKKGDLLPLDKTKKIVIVFPDKSEIYNYSNDKVKFSELLNLPDGEEVVYSLNPKLVEINKFATAINSADIAIFISYNGLLNQGQFDLYERIEIPHIAIAAGIPFDVEKFIKADTVLQSFCYKIPSLKAIAKIITN